jgi:hypothetical protein
MFPSPYKNVLKYRTLENVGFSILVFDTTCTAECHLPRANQSDCILHIPISSQGVGSGSEQVTNEIVVNKLMQIFSDVRIGARAQKGKDKDKDKKKKGAEAVAMATGFWAAAFCVFFEASKIL